MDKQAKKAREEEAPPEPENILKRGWSVGVGQRAHQPIVLVGIGTEEIYVNAAGAADLVVALVAAFDSAFPVEFRHLQRRMGQVIAMEAKDAPGRD